MYNRKKMLPISTALFQAFARHLSTCIVLFLLSVLLCPTLPAKHIDTMKMNTLFHSLEKREEAMGSLIISKNCTIVYKKSFGYRFIDEETKTKADKETRYHIWSISKTFSATMILQLVEEGKLNLNTPLAQFFPSIPHADKITLRLMLSHRSGIRDFTEDPAPPWAVEDASGITPEIMVARIASYEPSFLPAEDFRYSNSNFLLLGYIIEQLREMPYEDVLDQYISTKVGLKQTTYNQPFPRKNQNEAFSYAFDKKWVDVPEGGTGVPVPGAAGGIISTPTDLATFIEALFTGKLISKSSLELMLDKKDTYGLGIYRNDFGDHIGYGHSGAYIASFSDLTYYPEDSLTIAYCTNGHVYPKELVLEHVLRIIHNKPFAVSWSRTRIICIFLLFASAIGGYIFSKKRHLLKPEGLLTLGVIVPVLYWAGQLIGGLLYGDYSFQQQGPLLLNSFYSNSGNFMAFLDLSIASLSTVFLIGSFTTSKFLKHSVLPTFPILFLIISLAGQALFPSPHPMAVDFDQVYLLSFLGPLLSLIFWRKTLDTTIRALCILSLVFMLIPASLFISRVYPEFIFHHSGLLQRIIHVGWGIWFVALGIFLTNLPGSFSQNPVKFSKKTQIT